MVTSEQHEARQLRLRGLLDEIGLTEDARGAIVDALDEFVDVVREFGAQNDELRAELATLDTERERYRRLFEDVPDGYVITDVGGTIREVNNTAAILLARPRHALLGRDLARYVGESDRAAFGRYLGQIREAEPGAHISVNLAVDDRPSVPINMHATLGGPGPNGAIRIKWLLHDLRPELATTELRESEERLRRLLGAVDVGVVLSDAHGAIAFANHYADELLGYGSVVTSPTLRDATHPDDRSDVLGMIADAWSAATPGKLRHRLGDGDDVCWVDHSVAPFIDHRGTVLGIVSTLTDVTTEERAIAELRRSDEFNTTIVDTIGALIVVLDPAGRIRRFNPASEAVTGYRAADVIGRVIFDVLIPPEDIDAVRSVFTDVQLAGTNHWESDWIAADGTRRTISWSNSVLLSSSGSVRAVIGTGIDVSAQRALERRLAQSDRLEAIGRLTTGISHDFNNVLALLRLRVDRLTARHTDPDTVTDLEAIERSLDRTQRTIADLLSFSARQHLVPQPTIVNDEARRVVEMLAEIVDGGISIRFELTDDDTTVLVDSARLEQAITNLVLNARDALGDGGTITLASGVATVQDGLALGSGDPFPDLVDGDYVWLSVADDGRGISPENIARVFEPYFSTKPQGEGTGLGLATAYGTVMQSGGSITVDSKPGNGATFTLWLPSFESRSRTDRRGGRRDRDHPSTVLVVEDDDEVRDVVVDVLAAAGYRVREAAGGEQALALLDQPTDVLVTDVNLPDLGGRVLAARFQHADEQRPVLYISGAAPSELAGLEADRSALLRKPFTAEQLLGAVEALLESER